MNSMPAAAAAKSLQSCPTLCDPIDGSSPGSPVPGILQASKDLPNPGIEGVGKRRVARPNPPNNTERPK